MERARIVNKGSNAVNVVLEWVLQASNALTNEYLSVSDGKILKSLVGFRTALESVSV
jgi:hypothetical protein